MENFEPVKISNFTDLRVWKEAHRLVLETYKLTRVFPKDATYGVVSQMRRAAISVTSNIAEGFSRRTPKDKAQLYTIAAGSLSELQNQFIVSRDVGYLDPATFQLVWDQSIVTHRMLNGFIAKTRELF